MSEFKICVTLLHRFDYLFSCICVSEVDIGSFKIMHYILQG